MAKKTKLLFILFGFIISCAVGFYAGYIWSSLTSLNSFHKWSERRAKLQIRTEEYLPSCEELRNRGLPKIVKKDSDRFFVEVQDDYFIVFGFNAEPGKPPITAWWGSGLKAHLKQVCSE